MLSITEKSNYLAKVIQLGKPKKHPNADRLQIWNIGGYEVITDMSRSEGDICIYFPIECEIDHKILSNMNLFSDKDLNVDNTIAGYVHKSGRVRAIKLRDVMSEGMILPMIEVFNVLSIVKNCPNYNPLFWMTDKLVGEEFDTIDDYVICKKFIPEVKDVRSGGGTGEKKGPKVSDLLVENQFNFHYSTSKLQDNIWKFEDEKDMIVITDKWHGSSGITSRLLTKRELGLYQKFCVWFWKLVR